MLLLLSYFIDIVYYYFAVGEIENHSCSMADASDPGCERYFGFLVLEELDFMIDPLVILIFLMLHWKSFLYVPMKLKSHRKESSGSRGFTFASNADKMRESSLAEDNSVTNHSSAVSRLLICRDEQSPSFIS